MGIPHSKLFAIALKDYNSRYNGEIITKKLNEVYEKINKYKARGTSHNEAVEE
jgi:hypothetical protein